MAKSQSQSATPATAKQAAEKSPTFTKAGPGSRSGGKNRGQNGPDRVYTSSALEQRRRDALQARQESIQMFQERQIELAGEMLDNMSEFRGKPVNEDVRLGATALITNFRDATAKKENGQIIANRTKVAEDYAAMEISDEILIHPKRYASVQTGFRIARELLPKAYDAAKAEQSA